MNKRQQIERQLAALSNKRSSIAMALQRALDSLPPDEPAPEPEPKPTAAKKRKAAGKSPSIMPPAEAENAKAELTLSEPENLKTELTLSEPEDLKANKADLAVSDLEKGKAESPPVMAEAQPISEQPPAKPQNYTLNVNPKGFFYQAIAELPGELMEEEGQLFLRHGAAQIRLRATPPMVERLKGHIGEELTIRGWPFNSGTCLTVRHLFVEKPKERPLVMLAGLVRVTEDGLDILVPRNVPMLTRRFAFFHLSASDLNLYPGVRFVRCYACYGPDGNLKLSGITKASHHVPRYQMEAKKSP